MSLKKAYAYLLTAVLLFGTIGVFRRFILLPSGYLSVIRGVVGSLVLLTGWKTMDFAPLRKHWKLLTLSGAAIGMNWILLLESYQYTTIAVATLCHYLAPALMILGAPLFLRERLSLRRGICAGIAVLGMIPVSGLLDSGGLSGVSWRGILLALGAAVLYAAVVLINKFLTDVGGRERTVAQIAVAAVVALPYAVLCETVTAAMVTVTGVALALLLGIAHTGIAYALYYTALKALPAQNVAIISYADPVFAILLSATVLREPLTLSVALCGMLILGAILVSELPEKKR